MKHSELKMQESKPIGNLPDGLSAQVLKSIVEIDGVPVIADADVATLYEVETRRINEAVRNNPGKFPQDYMFELAVEQVADLRSKNSTTKVSTKSRAATKVFTEKGLYMLATVLKSRRATEVSFAIIETFSKVRELKRMLVALHTEKDKSRQKSAMHRFSELITDIVMPELETSETESTLELNFLIGKIKHTVKRVRRRNEPDTEEYE